ncbi:MAG TPA: hypothetical protein PLA50_10335, partial [Bacteroidia bacterium]|nr:hypothetical protein [Bacteroidia bacterium]
EDIKRIPEIIAASQAAEHAGQLVNAGTIRYFYDDPQGGTTTVLDEVRGRRGWLVPAQMIKFKKSGIREVPHQGNKKGRKS